MHSVLLQNRGIHAMQGLCVADNKSGAASLCDTG